MREVDGQETSVQAGQNNPALTRRVLQSLAMLLGAMRVDDSTGFVL
jgi:hypothetical protein